MNSHIVIVDSGQTYELTAEHNLLPLKDLCDQGKNVKSLKVDQVGELVALLNGGEMDDVLAKVSSSAEDEDALLVKKTSNSVSKNIVDFMISDKGIIFIDENT